ncbi:alpha/beta-hydrolase [Panus rudis PR-1116 ss-1]|nr:alpha/beta-hydrolase [Panus rudis PR-1116 ss-1]
MSELPFKLSIADSELELLKKKLELTRFPDELEGAEWSYGAPLADVKRLVAKWKDGFDWRKSEASINSIPQFTRDIEVGDGHGVLNVHYIHQKSEVDNAIPLLFVHGWPGHFLEVEKLLPILTSAVPEQPSFHVVALSLPGFGFSEAPKKKGFSAKHYAEIGHKLMLALGYTEYVTQGGDWGYLITRKIQEQFPQHAKAWHTNFPRGSQAPSFLSHPILYLQHLLTPYTPHERASLERKSWFWAEGRGYFQIQSTKPQTVGYGLTDSPVGLLAWIYEKLHDWTDEYPWDDDEVLKWVSIYWFSRAGPAASLRIYYEVVASGEYKDTPNAASRNPFGVSLFPKELTFAPSTWIQTLGNLVYEARHDKGGHFAAHEQPEVLADDLRKMFGKGGPAFGVVPGKSGYASS